VYGYINLPRTLTTRIFGRERGRLRSQGTMIGDFDLLTGATALRHDLAVFEQQSSSF
jgi:predicted nucleic acid-binding protein